MNQSAYDAKLTFTRKDAERVEIGLFRDETTVGRRDDNTICILDEQASKYHISIYRIEACCFLKDKASANGTYLNGNRVAQSQLIRLADGDTIGIGAVSFVFSHNAANANRKRVVFKEYCNNAISSDWVTTQYWIAQKITGKIIEVKYMKGIYILANYIRLFFGKDFYDWITHFTRSVLLRTTVVVSISLNIPVKIAIYCFYRPN